MWFILLDLTLSWRRPISYRNQSIEGANQWTGFYVISASVMKGLSQFGYYSAVLWYKPLSFITLNWSWKLFYKQILKLLMHCISRISTDINRKLVKNKFSIIIKTVNYIRFDAFVGNMNVFDNTSTWITINFIGRIELTWIFSITCFLDHSIWFCCSTICIWVVTKLTKINWTATVTCGSNRYHFIWIGTLY